MGKESSKLKNSVVKDIQLNAPFTEAEIEEWHINFLYDHPSGHMSFNEFLFIYKNMFPRGDPTLFAKRCFKSFDINGDGTIDFKEFLIGLGVIARGSTEKKLAWAFKVYDVNDDGTITEKEMRTMFEAISKMTGKLFDAEKATNELMQALEADQHKTLTKEKFVHGAKDKPHIIQLLTFIKSTEDSENTAI